MLKLTIIAPVEGEVDQGLEYLRSSCAIDVELKGVTLREGPSAIETDLDSLKAAPGIVERALEAEAAGADAIVINCMADPGLFATREAVSIPVVGAGEVAIQWAYMLGGRVGWIDVAPNARAMVQRQFDMYGLGNRYVAFSSITIQPTALKSSRAKVLERLIAAARRMIEEQGVNVIILGCTILTDLKEELLLGLNMSNDSVGEKLQIIMGLPLAVDTAAIFSGANIRHF